jgi:hypothetical protein
MPTIRFANKFVSVFGKLFDENDRSTVCSMNGFISFIGELDLAGKKLHRHPKFPA